MSDMAAARLQAAARGGGLYRTDENLLCGSSLPCNQAHRGREARVRDLQACWRGEAHSALRCQHSDSYRVVERDVLKEWMWSVQTGL